MILVCKTTACDGLDDYYGYAAVELTPSSARKLLALRAAWKAASDIVGGVYAVEFWDNNAEYGSLAIENGEYDIYYGEFADVSDFAKSTEDAVSVEGSVSCSTVKATDSGVVWQAMPKHSDGTFETPEIPWAMLEAVARGENPFAKTSVEDAKES